MVDLNRAREILSLESKAKRAAQELSDASMQLRRLGHDVKLTAWDWDKPGWTASIMPQGQIAVQVVDINERPKR